MTTIILKGLDKLQANGVAMLFEEGSLSEVINELLEKKFKDTVQPISEYPDVCFEGDDESPKHEVKF